MQYLHTNFVYLHGDTLFEQSILSDLIHAKGSMVLAVEEKACGEEEMKYTLDDAGHIIQLDKSIPSQRSRGEFLGVARFDANSLPSIKQATEALVREGQLNVSKQRCNV
jgi:choline kinase